jgi:hypothetical protein
MTSEVKKLKNSWRANFGRRQMPDFTQLLTIVPLSLVEMAAGETAVVFPLLSPDETTPIALFEKMLMEIPEYE